MMPRRSNYQIRPPPKEVFPESTLSPGGLQLTTLFWDTGILFHQGSHAGARVGNNFEVFGCIITHLSSKSNVPPHPTYWRRIPSPGGSFSLSTNPIPAFTSAAFQGGPGPHRHGRHQSYPRNSPSHTPLSHQMAGALNDCFSSGRNGTRVPTTIKTDNDQQLASPENAVRHAAEVAAAGLGPVQNTSAAPGSSTSIENNRQAASYYAGAGAYPSAPMGNSAPLAAHNHIQVRIPQFENATTQSMPGHDRTGVGGGRNSNFDAGDNNNNMHAGSGGLPLPAEHPTVQPKIS